MQATAAVETRVDDNAVAEVVLAENLGIHIAVAGIAHAPDVDIAQAAVGEFLHGLLVVLHPTVIKQLIHRAVADGFHSFFPCLATLFEGYQDRLSALVV